MLKIKDNVNLKELEKFNLKFDNETGEYYFLERNLLGTTYIKINSWNRKIKIKIEYDYDLLVLQIFYDLIQAGLVEEI